MRWLASLTILCGAVCGTAAGELHAGTGQPFATLRSALAAAQPGDTLHVHGGTYREGPLVIDKPLTLTGLDRPKLDGGGTSEILSITSSNVTVRGFEVRNGGSSSLEDVAGIRVSGANHVVIEDNRVVDCSFGIYFAKSRDAAARRNEILGSHARGSGNGNGIHGWNCERLEITANQVRDHRDGIYLEFASDSQITTNHVSGCLRYGLHFMTAHRNTYRENTFLDNGAGVAVMYSREVRMEANRFGHNWGTSSYGLLLKDITDSRITGNVFEFNSTAVTMQSSSRMAIEKNLFRENGWALQVQSSCDDNVFTGNDFIGNSFDLTSGGELASSRFENNYWDKAEIYDLNRDGIGDVPYRPLSLFAMLVERVPSSLLLLRSPLVHFLDRAERIFPTLTPSHLSDARPAMKPHPL